MSDLRRAMRMLAKDRGATLAAAILLALGIGANVLIFSVVNAVLLRPLPVRRPEELVRLVQRLPKILTESAFHYSFYRALRDHSTTLSVFGEARWDLAMNEPLPAEQVRVHFSTPEFFNVLGVRALHGRVLTPDDGNDNPGLPPAVLSYDFWRRHFHGDTKAIGKTIFLQRHPFLIVGVLPRDFNGISMDNAPDIRIPLRMWAFSSSQPPAQTIENAPIDLCGRLKPGVTPAQALAESTSLWHAAMERLAGNPQLAGQARFELGWPLDIDPLDRGISILRDRYASALKLLMACAGLLQLMVCANVAGLLLAKSANRRDEVAVRLALGATRSRLSRQMVIESLPLAALGAGGGVAIAFALTKFLPRALPPIRDLGTTLLTLTLDVRPNIRVLLFSIGTAAATALFFSLAPAIAVSRISLDSVLRGARSTRHSRGRQSLLLFQIALCTVLFMGAGLMVRTFENLRNLNPGFTPEHVVSFSIRPELLSYTPPQAQALRQVLLEHVRELPGVISAAASGMGIMRGRGTAMTVAPAGRRPSPTDFLNTSTNAVTPDYFETLGMRILEGRNLTQADAGTTKPVKVVVNRAFVRRFFPDVDPIGKRFGGAQAGFVAAPDSEIVGVVNDAKYRSLREPVPPIVYGPSSGIYDFVLYVRTRGRPEDLIRPVEHILSSLDPMLPVTEVHTLSDEIEASTAGERLTAELAAIFAALAALVTGVGLFALLSYALAQRQREFGIRMALGAPPSNIARLMALQAAKLALGGITLGLIVTILTANWIRSLLYGVAPLDLPSLTAAALFICLITAASVILPAVRASRLEPAAVIRVE